MTEIIENESTPRDHYLASLESGSLVMTPYCSCGNCLNEDYFCERCGKKCQCRLVICHDENTLQRVKQYIRKSSQFSGFKAKLAAQD